MNDNEGIKIAALLEKLEDALNAYYDTNRIMPYDIDTTLRNAKFCIESQKAEIKSLKSQVKRLKQYDEKRDIALHSRLIHAARSEAVKEFAERLKEDISVWSFDFTYYSDQLAACCRIDYLAKETEVKQ